MSLTLEELLENYPFLSFIKYTHSDYVGVIQNHDGDIVRLGYDFDKWIHSLLSFSVVLRSWNAAIFSDAPEMHRHQNDRNQRNGDAMPDVRAQERVAAHRRAAEKRETHVVVRRDVQELAERALIAKQRRGRARRDQLSDQCRAQPHVVVFRQLD